MNKLVMYLVMIMGVQHASAQMLVGADTLYGNEWIDYSKTYYKIKVANDGVYRISAASLEAAGLPVTSSPATALRLFHLGREQALYTSTDGPFSAADYLEFYGQKNRSELDQYLFDNPDTEMLNPRYSLFSDTAVYYLVMDGTGPPPLRITDVANDLSNPPPQEPYCWFQVERVYNTSHFKRMLSYDITMSWFHGEGFCKPLAASSPVTLNLPKVYPGGPAAKAALRYACNYSINHVQQTRVSGNGLDTLFFEDKFPNYGLVQHDFDLPVAFLGSNTKITLSGTELVDRNALAFASIQYARLPDAGNAPSFAFELKEAAGPRYLEIAGFSVFGETPVLYDLDQHLRVTTQVENNLVKVQLPAANGNRRLLLLQPASQITTLETLEPVIFQDYAGADAQYIIVSHPDFYTDPDNAGANPVAAYAAYRASAAGGNFTVANVNILDLYEQFAYGNYGHPLAIRNFAHWAAIHWTQPKYLFLIGKGLNYELMRDPATATALRDSLFFVPTFGTPGSDQLFLTGNKAEAPFIPVGRLAVRRPVEISDYLEKVKSHEMSLSAPQTISDRAWMKRILHIGGGTGAENQLIRNALGSMQQIVENNRCGAEVSSYYKGTDDPVQQSAYQSILQEVNEGVALMTMIGHSSPQVLDFDIGTPDLYNNQGRYPVMAPMGCFTGSCSMLSTNLGEQFMLARNRGAVAYFAFSYYSHYEALRKFGEKMYERMGGVDYGKSLGEQLAGTVAGLQGDTDPGVIALLHQLVLQGDPAIRIFAAPGPDLVIDPASVRFNPNPVGIEQGQFAFGFDVVNLGENTGGTHAVRIEHRFPNGNTTLLRLDTVPVPAFRTRMHYDFDAPDRSAIGLNRFLVTADADNTLAELPAAAEWNNELRDANNALGAEVYFFADDVIPISPQPYAIVGSSALQLQASTFNAFAPAQRYLFEIDTTPFFNSSLKKTGQQVQGGGLVSWQPVITMLDSTVYFWRVGRDSLVNGSIPWHTSSFLYLDGSPSGWNQSSFFQLGANDRTNLALDSSSRVLRFPDNAAYLTVSVAAFIAGKYPGVENNLYGGFTGYGGFVQRKINTAGVVLALIDPITGRFVTNPSGSPTNPDTTQDIHFHFFKTQEPAGRLALLDFLQYQIPDGYYVGLLTLQKPSGDTIGFAPNTWAADSIAFGTNIFQLLEAQGAKSVRHLEQTGAKPYGLIFRQNDTGFTAIDTLLDDPNATVELRKNYFTRWSEGEMESVAIGPAVSWKALHWKRGPYDSQYEHTLVKVYGLRENQPDSLLMSTEQAFDLDLSNISAVVFPKLRLLLEAMDSTQRTLPDFGFWRVLYTGLPEVALDPYNGFEFYNDTLQQGEVLRAGMLVRNVSATTMDSLLVKYQIANDGGIVSENISHMRALPPGDTLWARYTFDTRLLTGAYRFQMELNPGGSLPESFDFNNLALRPFFVEKDLRNPVLDVTFDGYHIMDGDLVSPAPAIVAVLQDDNRILAMSDTATFSLSLGFPDGSVQNISWNDPRVVFVPAAPGNLDKKNQAQLEFRPEFTLDGDYILKVNGRDASNNAAGNREYSIRFKVITRSAFSNVLNFPNPFSTSTCFVYTLSGSEIPLDFKIRIMTVSGKVVREITAAEFGPLRIGTHRSDYCWDGRDEYGDQLANGVYLYTILAHKADGSSFDLFEDNRMDSMFRNGWGKMVIIR
ncbi:MAG: hypothetical protein IPL65_03275 [Lewinellaceae bacterium]|nr:hypothetical protein [Lewinellaceae bacterium]